MTESFRDAYKTNSVVTFVLALGYQKCYVLAVTQALKIFLIRMPTALDNNFV